MTSVTVPAASMIIVYPISSACNEQRNVPSVRRTGLGRTLWVRELWRRLFAHGRAGMCDKELRLPRTYLKTAKKRGELWGLDSMLTL